MEKQQREIKVLSTCRGPLLWMNLCRKTDLEIFGFKIPNIVIFSILSIPLCNGVLGTFRLAFDIGFNFEGTASLLMSVLGLLQMQAIYFCLVNKNQIIIEMVDHIQDVVNRSNLHLFFTFSHYFSFFNFLVISLI